MCIRDSNYTLKDTFMGFHCGNTASSKLSFCEMKYQMIMARSLPIEVTNGTLEGDIKPGDITFYRLQSTADNKMCIRDRHRESEAGNPGNQTICCGFEQQCGDR